MSKQKKEKKEEAERNNRAKEIWLAGLGALSAVEEEGSKLFRSLVSRGAEFEKNRKEDINEIMDEVSDRYNRVGNKFGETVNMAEEGVEKNVKSVISSLGIPTRKEVEDLSKKVDGLIAKLDALEKKQSGSSSDPGAKKETDSTKKSGAKGGK